MNVYYSIIQQIVKNLEKSSIEPTEVQIWDDKHKLPEFQQGTIP